MKFKLFNNLFKRGNKPSCYGDSHKLSINCHECEIKEKCLDDINSKASGTHLLPSNKPHPKAPILSKEVTWSLENARNDFRKATPKCDTCKFSTFESDRGYDIYSVDRDYTYCHVKNIEVKNKDAEQCKYYTVE